ncbi:SIS domain-containing protein [Methyloglobulus sp.]|uniref:SIS domain-containing protein n=1 Tax=Methyloglobulus sp. TaxID=2518622 RepID=UPI00398A1D40
MSLQNRIINHFTDSIQTKQDALNELCELIELASQRLVAALLNDRKIFSCGNGRSAASAQLLSSALLNKFERDRPSLPAIALTMDTTTVTAIANDYGYEEVFSKPIRSLGQNGDVLVTYTDGNHSANIAKAIAVSHAKDISIIALTGRKSEAVSALLTERDLEIRVPSSSAIRTHEVHVLITHCLCDLIDHQLFDGMA